MANANENRIDKTISAADLTKINDGLKDAGEALDEYTQPLVEAERNTLFGIGPDNLSFINDALTQGNLLSSKLPPAIQVMVGNLATDVTLVTQLEAIDEGQLAQLVQRISDTRRLASHEAYVGALALYKIIEAFAALGVEGFQAAYDILKVRFAAQGGGRPAGGVNP